MTQGTTPEGTTDSPKDNTEHVPNKLKVKRPLCKESHWLSRCQLFRRKSVDERISFVHSRGSAIIVSWRDTWRCRAPSRATVRLLDVR